MLGDTVVGGVCQGKSGAKTIYVEINDGQFDPMQDKNDALAKQLQKDLDEEISSEEEEEEEPVDEPAPVPQPEGKKRCCIM